MTVLTQASHQWMSRPADQRFLSLPDLMTTVSKQKMLSSQNVVSSRKIEVQPVDGDSTHKAIQIVGPNGNPTTPTHYSFGQLAQLSGAPAAYLRKLPAPIVADAMNYGLRFNRDVEDVKVLLTKGEELDGGIRAQTELRAATGPNYGRIWNEEIVGALMNKFGDGRTGDFRVPGEFGKQVNVTKENTTIYGSDRDIFVFLADEEHRIEMKDRRAGEPGSLARGFFVWNSEVGASSIGAAFFLFDYVCMNRIVWGVKDFKEIRLRHTASAPDRYLEEIAPVLMEYANASAAPIEATIRAAQEKSVKDDLDAFLQKRFTKSETVAIKAAHEREESRPIESVWDAVTAITAHAKTLPYQDARVAMEREGGKVLDLVAA